MIDYLFLMHDDGTSSDDDDWERYIAKLQESGHFNGGSAVGGGECVKKSGVAPKITAHLTGYIRVQAEDFNQAKDLLDGNPVYETGGTVEIRELPSS
jgi:hypothetical protein